jgi:hypothetical protein
MSPERSVKGGSERTQGPARGHRPPQELTVQFTETCCTSAAEATFSSRPPLPIGN